MILVDAANVDGGHSGNETLKHLDDGTGPIATVGNYHTDATCYAYNRIDKGTEYMDGMYDLLLI